MFGLVLEFELGLCFSCDRSLWVLVLGFGVRDGIEEVDERVLLVFDLALEFALGL